MVCHVVRYCTVSMATASSRSHRDSPSASGKRRAKNDVLEKPCDAGIARSSFSRCSEASLRADSRKDARRVRFAGRKRKTFRHTRDERRQFNRRFRCGAQCHSRRSRIERVHD